MRPLRKNLSDMLMAYLFPIYFQQILCILEILRQFARGSRSASVGSYPMAIRLHKALEFLCCQTTTLPLELPGWNVVVSTLRQELLDKEIGEISEGAVLADMINENDENEPVEQNQNLDDQ